MNLQQSILDEYLSHFKKPTLKQISDDTGIQLTRVFRILNGAVMHLNEYETFYNRVQERKLGGVKLEELIKECQVKLSSEVLAEIKDAIQKKLYRSELIRTSLKLS